MHKTFITRIFAKIEQTKISGIGFILVFCCILFVRFFLESFSNKSEGSMLNTNPQMLLHYAFFFATAFLLIVLIIVIASRKSVREILNVVLVGFFIIWLPPLIDLCVSAGEGLRMAYLFRTPAELWHEFFTIGSTGQTYGFTTGIRIEALAIMGISYLYVLHSTTSHLRSLFAAGLIYSGLFLLAAIPSLLGIIGNNILMETLTLTKDSFLEYNFIHNNVLQLPLQNTMEYFFNHIMLQTLYFLLLPLLLTIGYLASKPSLSAFIKNSRPERLAHYFVLLSVGIYLAHTGTPHVPFFGTLLNVATIVTLYLSVYFAWLFSVGMNDLADLESDRLSNTNRPLVTGSLTENEMRSFSFISLTLALVGGYLVGKDALFLLIILIAISYLYSTPPIRFKRFFLMNSFIIALAALIVVMIGFFAVAADHQVAAFSFSWILMILIFYFLLSPVKDIKDIAGDKATGVSTIPTVLGDKRGKLIVSILIIIGLALIPLFTSQTILWYIFPQFSILVYLLINRVQKYQDKYLFYLYLAYILASIALVAFL